MRDSERFCHGCVNVCPVCAKHTFIGKQLREKDAESGFINRRKDLIEMPTLSVSHYQHSNLFLGNATF
jgi:hypothetical protein